LSINDTRLNQLEPLVVPRNKNDVVEQSYLYNPNITLLSSTTLLETNNNVNEGYVQTTFAHPNIMTSDAIINNQLIHHHPASVSTISTPAQNSSLTCSSSPALTERSLASKPSSSSSPEPLTFIKFEEPEFMEKNEPEIEDESLHWVNPKQYRRILKRRVARAKLDAKYGGAKVRKVRIENILIINVRVVITINWMQIMKVLKRKRDKEGVYNKAVNIVDTGKIKVKPRESKKTNKKRQLSSVCFVCYPHFEHSSIIHINFFGYSLTFL
jgi:hypothetical protein